MAERRLMHRVEEVADRLQYLRRITARSRTWLLLAVAGLMLLAANWLMPVPLLSPAVTGLTGILMIVVGGLFSMRERASIQAAATTVEERFPGLDARLVTAIAQRPDMDEGGFSFLQHEVISEALVHAQRHDWRDAVPARSLAAAKLKQFALLVMVVAVFVGATLAGFRRSVETTAAEPGAVARADDGYGLTVQPGHVEIERGTSLLVLARFSGQLPRDVTLVTNAADGTRNQIPLSKSLEDPIFGGRVAQVESDLNYHVRYDDRQSEDYRVTVFDYPRLLQADATVAYPAYTGQSQKQIEDVRRVSVVEGSQLTLTCTLNKPIATAKLVDVDGPDKHTLVTDPVHAHLVSVTWQPGQRQAFSLELTDDEGRKNKHPPKFVIDVIPNQAPDLKVAFPSRDMRVSPIQELALQATAWDDFGLKEFGLVYQLPDGREQTLKLGEEAAADAKVDLSHELSFEAMLAEPNELVAYYFYADDIGPNGDPRRTLSNMYFAEVRHFDEIYRQAQQSGGQQQQQGEGQQGGPSQQLLRLQREIVTATWNLIRRETGEPSQQLPEDAGIVAESQGEAFSLADEAKGQVEDLLSRQYLAAAIEQMQAGEKHLRLAAETPAVEPLSEAGVSTQAAYRALLKLQARENLVQQSQRSQNSSSQGGQQQLNEQLQQLELKNNRNRYESEQQAATPADRETLQALNRLRELARRQGDLNEKIQELENELRAAENEEERREIERQLKRLQEEQQQLLRDLDELNERMERPENRSQMADARQQLQETRERLRETKEQLQQGQVSKALASGTRAQRELEELKNELRDQTANQFAETMRDLREEVRELAEREQEIGEQLAGNQPQAPDSEPGRPQLRDETPDGRNLQDAVEQQRQKLDDVMQQAEGIVREAELSEPLLSKKLYDTIRNTRVDQPEQSLTMTSQFLKLGLKREASQAEQQARRGIDKLREGVEQAAESVLGNEVASLERAQEELDDLAQAIAAELAQADPNFAEELEEAARQEQSGGARQPSANNGQPSQEGQPESQQEPSDRSGGQTPADAQRDQDAQSRQQSGEPSSDQQQGERQSGRPSESRSPQQQSQSGQGQQQGSSSDQQSQQAGGGRQPQQSTSPSQRGGNRTDRAEALSTLLNLGQQDGGGAFGPHLGPRGPLSTSEFKQWSDRMRDVEEMLQDPELRGDVARIRERATEMRIDVKRHSKQPDWELVRLTVYGPLLELEDRIAEEIARLKPADEQIVPLDRDPVPDRYAELVRQYYERLGSSGLRRSDSELTPAAPGTGR